MNFQLGLPNRDELAEADTGVLELPLGAGGPAAAEKQVAALSLPAVRSLEKRRLQCYLVLILVDVVAVIVGFALGAMIMFRTWTVPHALLQGEMLLPLFLTFALYNGSYSLDTLANISRSIRRVLQALALGALTMLFITYLSKTSAIYSRLTFASGLVATTVLLAVFRVGMQKFVQWRCGDRVENILVVRDGGPDIVMEGAYYVDSHAHRLRPDIADPAALDQLGHWFLPMDRVLVSCPADRRVAWAMALKGLAIEGEVVDETVEAMGALGARRVGGQGFLLVSHSPLGLRARAMKRAFDLALTIPALIVLAPVMLIVAIAIRLEDRGPTLFVQHRTGRASRFFSMYKFRSMRVANQDIRGDRSASRDDDRVTRVGRFIQRTSIDELPQLFNVLKGDMSHSGVSKLT